MQLTTPFTRLALTWLALSPTRGQAQRLEPGARVRVTYDCVIRVSRSNRDESCRRADGLVIAQDSTGLIVARSLRGTPARLGLSTITRIEISVGSMGHASRGALLGGLILGVVTAFGTEAVLKAAYCDAPRCGDSGFALLWGFLPGFGIGAAIGQAIGAGVTSDLWQEVPREQLAPEGRRPAHRWRLGWSLAF